METESRMGVHRGCGRGENREVGFMVIEFLFGVMKMF